MMTILKVSSILTNACACFGTGLKFWRKLFFKPNLKLLRLFASRNSWTMSNKKNLSTNFDQMHLKLLMAWKFSTSNKPFIDNLKLFWFRLKFSSRVLILNPKVLDRKIMKKDRSALKIVYFSSGIIIVIFQLENFGCHSDTTRGESEIMRCNWDTKGSWIFWTLHSACRCFQFHSRVQIGWIIAWNHSC